MSGGFPMRRIVAIVTILLPAAVMAAVVNSGSPTRLDVKTCGATVLALNADQASSRGAVPGSGLGIVAEAGTPISHDRVGGKDRVALNTSSEARGRSPEVPTVKGQPTSQEEGEEEEDRDEEEEKEGEEN
jgi:hypothetical protein